MSKENEYTASAELSARVAAHAAAVARFRPVKRTPTDLSKLHISRADLGLAPRRPRAWGWLGTGVLVSVALMGVGLAVRGGLL